ncbi:MAG: reverse transcriptase/maturase family protein [Phoenicibacter congonensis]|uniref:Reverse transcriptase/maturase family protein n=1 Tax=Phoenicibacter congonensis TaxID=1944646 RepID=A0AA43RIU9_9ACTN|nr:reverse transcriptase/maturase family protein [Phoenicibacter congonensis]
MKNDSLLDRLSDHSEWEAFYEYKNSLACPKRFARELRAFIDAREYLPVCAEISAGGDFPLPKKAVISKMSTAKKRVVYTYPRPENTVLKLLTHLLIRKYDCVFPDNLYSFRVGRTAKDAIRRITRVNGIRRMYSYKVDIHDYFNSVPAETLLPMLADVIGEDGRLYSFLASLLLEKRVLEKWAPVEERKGIMAGTPLSAFYANLFLSELDRRFAERGAVYARYSDDIIVFAPTREECEAYAAEIREFLRRRSLEVNPAKERFSAPEEGFVFLGFSVMGDKIDIAPATVAKLKGKMRRKRDALRRWSDRSGAGGERAAAAFIRVFNRKLLDGADDGELTWSRWFFSVINTDGSLREIDSYAQDCIRYLVSGRHTKARFGVRYSDMKALGYRSLLHEYYAFADEK